MSDYEIQVLYYLGRLDDFCYNYLFPFLVLLLFAYVLFKLIRRTFLL